MESCCVPRLLEGLRDLRSSTPAHITQGPQASQAPPSSGQNSQWFQKEQSLLSAATSRALRSRNQCPCSGFLLPSLLPLHPQPDLTWPLLLQGDLTASVGWSPALHMHQHLLRQLPPFLQSRGEAGAYRHQIICHSHKAINGRAEFGPGLISKPLQSHNCASFLVSIRVLIRIL